MTVSKHFGMDQLQEVRDFPQVENAVPTEVCRWSLEDESDVGVIVAVEQE